MSDMKCEVVKAPLPRHVLRVEEPINNEVTSTNFPSKLNVSLFSTGGHFMPSLTHGIHFLSFFHLNLHTYHFRSYLFPHESLFLTLSLLFLLSFFHKFSFPLFCLSPLSHFPTFHLSPLYSISLFFSLHISPHFPFPHSLSRSDIELEVI